MNSHFVKIKNDILKYEYWLLDGKLHNEDGPAVIFYYPNGQIVSQGWFFDGQPLSEDGKSFYVEYDIEGNVRSEFFVVDVDESLSRKIDFIRYTKNGNPIPKDSYSYQDSPHYGEYTPNKFYVPRKGMHSVVLAEEWLTNGIRNNTNGPSVLKYFEGWLFAEEWYVNNQLHRENGPAVIKYYKTGRKRREKWYKNGLLHNEKGPAYIKYNRNGTITRRWYINGDELSEEEWIKWIKFDKIDELWSNQGEDDDNYFQYLPYEMVRMARNLYK